MDNNEFVSKAIADDTLMINTPRVIDNNNALDMVDVISTALKKGYKELILDMTNTEFISSAGVGSILGTIEASRENGGDIIICNASDNIMHIFDVLDLTDYLTIKHNTAEALEYCKTRS